MKRHLSLSLLFFALLATWSRTLTEEKVIRCAIPNRSLDERWAWAHQRVASGEFDDGCWIGYSVQRLMERNSFIGSFSTDRRRNRPSLTEVITGTTLNEIDQPQPDGNTSCNFNGIISLDGKNSGPKVMKEVAVLFHYRKHDLKEVVVSNACLRVKLDGDPLLWLEGATDDESIALLQSCFSQARSSVVKEKLVTAIGLHPEQVSYPVLKNILVGSEPEDVRENAAFWISQCTTSDEAVKLLSTSAQSDRSEDVREKALFGLSEMETDRATESLIAIARSNSTNDVRKRAMFWLGQKASEKAVATLQSLVDDEDTEIQKSALFALTQLPDGRGVKDLIRIAKSHTNSAVRKEAIFWLGQSDDVRALDALVEIARK